jgi:alpha/beta superfamily hydrolase
MEFHTEKVLFKNAQGIELSGRLERPTAAIKAFAIFAHCFTCSKDIFAVSRISRQLAQKGVATLRFDFAGLGESDGDFADTSFSSNLGDLIAAYEYLKHTEQAPKLLIGHSFGGVAVLAVAEHMAEVTALVTINSPSSTTNILQTLDKYVDEIQNKGQAQVILAGRRFIIRREFLEDVKNITLEDKIEKLNKSLLVLHSPQDEVVSIEHAKKIIDLAPYPKSFVTVDGANHLLSNAKDSTFVAAIISLWAERYI